MDRLTRREFLTKTGCGAAAIAAARHARAGETAHTRGNVLFIAIDDLNDWIGCLDSPIKAHTPNIDRLAKRGMIFTDAHCAAPACGPSRAAVFSGRQPYNTGVYTNDDSSSRLIGKIPTIPEHFQSQGYATFGTGKLLHGGSKTNTRVFESYGPGYNKWTPLTLEETKISEDELADNKPYVRHKVDRLNTVLPLNHMPRDRNVGSSTIESFDWGPFDVDDDVMSDAECAKWAVERIKDQHDKPFFLGVGFYRPHQPLFAPRKYHDMYPPGSVKLPHVPKDDLDDLSKTGRDFAVRALTSGLHETVIKYGQWEEAVSSYLACVTFVDTQVGRVLDALDASPYADNTTIILWTDHGWHLGEKEHWGKFTGWQRSTRVPLIIVPPKSNEPAGYVPGQRCDKLVNLVDMYPTLIELTDARPADNLDGRSLVPLLQNHTAPWYHPAITTFGRGNHSLCTPRWRYIRYYDGSEELYDRNADPNEWNNQAGKSNYAPIIKKLRRDMPKNETVDHFVRMGKWKAVLTKKQTDSELFDLEAGNWVAEKKNVADDHPDIIAKMRTYIKENHISKKYLTIPDN